MILFLLLAWLGYLTLLAAAPNGHPLLSNYSFFMSFGEIQRKGICLKAKLECIGLKMVLGYWLHQEDGCFASSEGQTLRFPPSFCFP